MNQGVKKLTKQALNRYRLALEAKLKELGPVKERIADIQISTQSDPNDGATAMTVHLAISSADLNSTLRRQIIAALRRIQDGTYGICLGCEEKIEGKRLNAVPWTPCCITCQEKTEKQDSDLAKVFHMP